MSWQEKGRIVLVGAALFGAGYLGVKQTEAQADAFDTNALQGVSIKSVDNKIYITAGEPVTLPPQSPKKESSDSNLDIINFKEAFSDLWKNAVDAGIPITPGSHSRSSQVKMGTPSTGAEIKLENGVETKMVDGIKKDVGYWIFTSTSYTPVDQRLLVITTRLEENENPIQYIQRGILNQPTNDSNITTKPLSSIDMRGLTKDITFFNKTLATNSGNTRT